MSEHIAVTLGLTDPQALAAGRNEAAPTMQPVTRLLHALAGDAPR